MTPARFGLQALIVLALVALVSWPEHRQLRAGAFWHGVRAVQDGSGMTAGRREGAAGRYQIGYGSASEAVLGPEGASALHRTLLEQDADGSRRGLPPVVRFLGGRLNAIVGAARTSLDAPMAFARVVLRSLGTGAVEARGVADEHGRFTFLDVVPGGYLVELVDEQGRVIAASGPIVIGVNEVRETVVRPSGRRVLAAFGGVLTPSAQETMTAAAADSVGRVAAPERCASPPCIGPAQ